MSTDKLAKKSARKQKEIAKWEREKARPKKNYYFAYLVFIITLIYATDEIASQIGTLMKTEIANDLFSKYGESSVGLLDILSILVVPFQALGLLYRPLADRWGRKKYYYHFTVSSELDEFEEKAELNMRRIDDGWNLLDTYGITGDTLIVRLTDESELNMIAADAVKLVRKN